MSTPAPDPVPAPGPAPASTIRCAGCGYQAGPGDPYPFACPRAGTDDTDHVMARVLDTGRLSFPEGHEPNPFLRYRALLHSYHRALAHGLSDEGYRALVASLDGAVAAVDGRGFAATPLFRSAELSGALGFTGGGVWVKDETGNVSGSHKGRHLMGVLLHLAVAEKTGLAGPADRPELAIASCGNAALAAAVVARAGGWSLTVLVPPDAHPAVVRRLRALHARVVVCHREPGVAGDPAYLRLRELLGQGALPFTTQGNENGLCIEGGETLGYELVTGLRGQPGGGLDHLVIQVGGGALASACIQALREAVQLGALPRLPRIHTVQTFGAHPLERAWELIRARLPERPSPDDVRAAVAAAAAHRSRFMWPWEEEPKSVATGILDDETYDWRAVVEGMLLTGGRPLVVSEDLLVQANELAAGATGIAVDPTGSSGLAGLLELRRRGLAAPGDRIGVLFTGTRR